MEPNETKQTPSKDKSDAVAIVLRVPGAGVPIWTIDRIHLPDSIDVITGFGNYNGLFAINKGVHRVFGTNND